MKATLEIDMGNAAFESPSELPRILRELADRIEERGEQTGGDVFRVRDINGNAVGGMYISD